MPTIQRQGASIHYEVSGDGPPVLLGHSLLCDGRMWERVAPLLAKRWRLYNVDARGHRHSSAPAPFSLDDLAADWRAILDHEQIDRAALCGLSMGGMTAMRLALAAPERIGPMVLLDTSADREPGLKRVRYAAMAAITRRFGYIKRFEPTVAKALFGATTLADHREIADAELARIRERDWKATYHAIHAIIGRASIAEAISIINTATLVIVGDEDVATPPDRARRITARIPGARLEIVPRSGHLSTLEAPDVVGALIADFLSKHAW